MDIINEIKKFTAAAGVLDADADCTRNVALYIGLQCEELAEKLEVLNSFWVEPNAGRELFLPHVFHMLKDLSTCFKRGTLDARVEACLDRPELRVGFLDADLDLAWVSIGAALAMGANVEGGFAEVNRSNQAKINPATGQMLKDENGKVMKPEGWKPPDLTPFV